MRHVSGVPGTGHVAEPTEPAFQTNPSKVWEDRETGTGDTVKRSENSLPFLGPLSLLQLGLDEIFQKLLQSRLEIVFVTPIRCPVRSEFGGRVRILRSSACLGGLEISSSELRGEAEAAEGRIVLPGQTFPGIHRSHETENETKEICVAVQPETSTCFVPKLGVLRMVHDLERDPEVVQGCFRTELSITP